MNILILISIYAAGFIITFLNMLVVKTGDDNESLTTFGFRLFWGLIVGLLWPLFIIAGLIVLFFVKNTER